MMFYTPHQSGSFFTTRCRTSDHDLHVPELKFRQVARSPLGTGLEPGQAGWFVRVKEVGFIESIPQLFFNWAGF
jgi:hypothetical protein